MKVLRFLFGATLLGLFLVFVYLLMSIGSTSGSEIVDPVPGPDPEEVVETGVTAETRRLTKKENVRYLAASTTKVEETRRPPLKELSATRERYNASDMLELIKEHLDEYYTAEDIYLACCMLQTEDWVAHSQTVWSAHIWVLVNRLNQSGFEQSDSLTGLITARNQFWVDDYSEIDPEIDWIVRDVLSRSVLEGMGYPEGDVGRTLPPEYRFFNKATNSDIYNAFYARCTSDGWGEPYDPFSAPFNPYEN